MKADIIIQLRMLAARGDKISRLSIITVLVMTAVIANQTSSRSRYEIELQSIFAVVRRVYYSCIEWISSLCELSTRTQNKTEQQVRHPSI